MRLDALNEEIRIQAGTLTAEMITRIAHQLDQKGRDIEISRSD